MEGGCSGGGLPQGGRMGEGGVARDWKGRGSFTFGESTCRSNPTLTRTLILTLAPALGQALIKTEYWDRAGAGGNISYDW